MDAQAASAEAAAAAATSPQPTNSTSIDGEDADAAAAARKAVATELEPPVPASAAVPSATKPPATPAPAVAVVEKVKVNFMAVGSAPMLKKAKVSRETANSIKLYVFMAMRAYVKLPILLLVLTRKIVQSLSVSLAKFLVDARTEFSVVSQMLRKQLHLSPSSSLFLYTNSAFSPSPDEQIGCLSECFAAKGGTGELLINYSLQEAWG
jgi:ubiquitin-like protein ATG12